MADSTSESSNVVPLFPQETVEKSFRRGGSGTGGGDHGARIRQLEKQVTIISGTLEEICKDIGEIEKRTRYQNSPATHKEVLIWFALFAVAIGSAYYVLTPIMIKANQNESVQKISENLEQQKTSMQKISENLEAIKDESHKTRKP